MTNSFILSHMPACPSSSERNYAITELETLAVVWALSHFHCYIPIQQDCYRLHGPHRGEVCTSILRGNTPVGGRGFTGVASNKSASSIGLGGRTEGEMLTLCLAVQSQLPCNRQKLFPRPLRMLTTTPTVVISQARSLSKVKHLLHQLETAPVMTRA